MIVRGRARLVADSEERRLAFRSLMKKYQPKGSYGDYLPEKLAITGIVRIEIEQLTGKEDLGKGEVRKRLLGELERGATLPLVL